MDQSEIHINETQGKSLKGLQDKGVVIIKCADCGHELLQLQLATTDSDDKAKVLTRIIVQCGFCDGFSYVKQIPGQFYPGAPNDNMIFDIVDNVKDAPEADVIFKAWKK